MAGPEATSRGVDTLIAKLRQDGVEAGRREAARLTAEAEAEAARLIAKAKAEADRHLDEARKSADRYRAAGEEALNTAMRDAVLTMKSGLMAQFQADVRRMVGDITADPEMVKQMVLEIVGRARDTANGGEGSQGAEATDVILPAVVIGPEAIAEDPELIQSGKLTEFAVGLAGERLKDGVTLYAADDFQGGIKVRVHGKDIDFDLSDEAIARLLMQHLQPRFRAAMEGVIT